MLIKATAIVKFSGIYKWDIINPLKDCLKNGKPIKNEQLGYECNVFDLFINALQCIYELTNKILDMQVKDKYLNLIVVDINQK